MGRRPLKPGGGAEGSALQKDKIVEAVALEMAEGNWRPVRSVRELAARLGVSLSQAERYSAEATRLLRLSWGQDEAKIAVLERISRIGQAAEERTEEALDMSGAVHTLRKPDHRTALAAAKHLADCLGLSGTNSEVVIRYQQMTDSDLLNEVRRLALMEGKKNGRIIEIDGEEIPEPEREREPEPTPSVALDRVDPANARRGW